MRILAAFVIIAFLAFTVSARPGGKIQKDDDNMQQEKYMRKCSFNRFQYICKHDPTHLYFHLSALQ